MSNVDREHLAWASVFMDVDDTVHYELFRSALRSSRLVDLRLSRQKQLDTLRSQRTDLIQGSKWEKIGIDYGGVPHSLWPLTIWLPLPVSEFYFQAAFPGQATVRLDAERSMLDYELLLYRPDDVSSEKDDALRAKEVISQWAAYKSSRVVRVCTSLDSIQSVAFYRLNKSLGMLCVEVSGRPSFEWQFVFETLDLGFIHARDRDDFTPDDVASRCGRHYVFSDIDPLLDFMKALVSSSDRMRMKQQRICDLNTNLYKEMPQDGATDHGRQESQEKDTGLRRKPSGRRMTRQQSAAAMQRWQKVAEPVVSGKFRVSHRWSKQNLVPPSSTPRQEIIAVLVKHGLVSPELHSAPPIDASTIDQLPFILNNYLGNEQLKIFNPCFVDYLNFLCEDPSDLDSILAKTYCYSEDGEECTKNGIVTAALTLLDEAKKNDGKLDYYFSLCIGMALPCKEFKHCPRCHKCVSWRYWHCYACETCSRGQTSVECQNCSSRRRFAAKGSDAELLARYGTDKPDWKESAL